MSTFRLRYYRRLRILPGLRLNLSKGGVSASLGGRGAWYTVTRNGRRRVTVGVPGTGVYFTKVSRVPTASDGTAPVGTPARRSVGARILRWALIAFAIYAVVALLVVVIGGALLSSHH